MAEWDDDVYRMVRQYFERQDDDSVDSDGDLRVYDGGEGYNYVSLDALADDLIEHFQKDDDDGFDNDGLQVIERALRHFLDAELAMSQREQGVASALQLKVLGKLRSGVDA